MRRLLAGVVVVSLAVYILYSAVGVSSESSVWTGEVSPKILPESAMPPFLFTYGHLPTFRDDADVVAWLEMLASLGDELDGPDVPYGETLVVGHGAGADGYYWIVITKGKVAEVTQAVVEEIATEVNRIASDVAGFTEPVPLKFAEASGEGGYYKDQDEEWRPVIGGVQIQDRDQSHTLTSTLGYAAKVENDEGFVVAGHIGYGRRVPTGTTIYQPTYSGYPTDDVDSVAGRSADADVAWIQYSNVSAKVWVSGTGFSIRFASEPVLGTAVHKSGRTTGVTNGTVKYVNHDEFMNDTIYYWLYDQTIVDIEADQGDSGAPLWRAVSGYGRGIQGILSGPSVDYEDYERFSPQSGVKDEVNADPLTIYD